MSTFPKGIKQTKKQISELLRDNKWKTDPALTKALNEAVYYDDDGRLLHEFFDGKGVLYEDGESFRKVILEVARAKPEHLLEGIFTYNSQFVRCIDKLAENLVNELNLSDDFLDFSWERLKQLDKKLITTNKEKFLKPELFSMIVAYVGEVLRREIDGKWFMKHIESAGVWEPWVVLNDKKSPVFSIVYNELYEAHPSMSLSGALTSELKRIKGSE